MRRGPFLQVSGQGPVDPETNEYLHPGDVKAQTERTLRNVEAVLAAGGAGFGDVMMLRVYLTTRDDFAAMNEAYGEFLAGRVASGVLPARTTVFTGLPRATANCTNSHPIQIGSTTMPRIALKPNMKNSQ